MAVGPTIKIPDRGHVMFQRPQVRAVERGRNELIKAGVTADDIVIIDFGYGLGTTPTLSYDSFGTKDIENPMGQLEFGTGSDVNGSGGIYKKDLIANTKTSKWWMGARIKPTWTTDEANMVLGMGWFGSLDVEQMLFGKVGNNGFFTNNKITGSSETDENTTTAIAKDTEYEYEFWCDGSSFYGRVDNGAIITLNQTGAPTTAVSAVMMVDNDGKATADATQMRCLWWTIALPKEDMG